MQYQPEDIMGMSYLLRSPRAGGRLSAPARWVALAILLLVTAGYMVQGRAGTTGKIAGVVRDKSTGEPLVGVNVYLEGHPLGAATDADGYYFIINIPPGSYTLVTQMVGYQEVRITGVEVKVDLTTHVNVELPPEAVQGREVVVVSERPLIQKDLTSTSVNISSEEIKALPVDNFNEVVQLQAGVVAGHFRGGRLGEVAYMIDGIPVNDRFNNSLGIQVENTSIQQLEVISGTFNAEYGQALSGVVNIVTREGGNDYQVELSGYAGNYYSTHEKVFPFINSPNLSGFQNVQATLSGPVPFFRKLKFFGTYRYLQNDGYLFSRRVYLPSDDDPFDPHGDGAVVPLSDSKRQSFYGKLTYYITPSLKLNYAYLWEDNTNRYYNHSFRMVPDATKRHFRTSNNHNLQINHAISKSTFYTLKLARNFSDYAGYVYEDPFDLRYLDSNNGQPRSNYTFRSGGNESDRYSRNTTTYLAKWDLTSQVTRVHKLGVGITVQKYRLYNFWTNLDIENSSPEKGIVYPEPFTPGREEYTKEPFELAAYLQDKVEFDNFIINLGVRYDYFDPRTEMPADPRNPELIELFPHQTVKASAKSQISPRFGVAFPISSAGVIHVSYGHFFQIPNFEYLYQGITDSAGVSKFYLPREARLSGLKGNPDLKPQRTVMYEMGLQQALTDQLVVEFTAYYRDIRDLVATEIQETYDTKQYGRYINHDYGNVTGAILSIEKRFSDHWSARLDYTYQIAEGNSSDPRTVFWDNQADPPREPEKQLIRLDWDQRHTLNLALNVGTPNNWNVGLVGKFGSGTPYTAASRFLLGEIVIRNNRTKPTSILFDLKAEKYLHIHRLRLTAYLWVTNLFDRLNEWNVYASTGRANNDLEARLGAGEIIGLHTLDDYLTNPTFYSPPREIRLGISAGL
ncbi:MAG: TonB-dependent receptor [Calditrichaeota bacterium]|nr:MAG: TonB-dependent receptor [Calditrichota bacterium]